MKLGKQIQTIRFKEDTHHVSFILVLLEHGSGHMYTQLSTSSCEGRGLVHPLPSVSSVLENNPHSASGGCICVVR